MSRSNNQSTLFAQVAKDSSASGSDHPEIETLTSYHDGRLPEEDVRKLLDHVQGCRDCTSLLLDLGRLDPAALDEADEVAPDEIERGWAALKTRLPANSNSPFEKKAAVVVSFPQAGPAASSRRTPSWVHALAAGLLLAVVGQTVRLQGLQREIDRLGEPQINTPYVILSDARARGAEESSQIRTVPGSTDSALLIITPNVLQGPQTKTYGSFRAEIVGANRRWSATGLVLGEQRDFRISISKRYFGAEEAQVRLFGVSGDQEDMLAQFRLRLDSN